MTTTKIPDATFIIALCSDVDGTYIFEDLLKSGCRIKVPLAVYGELKGKTFEKAQPHFKKNELVVIKEKLPQDFVRFKERYPYLGNGDIEVILWGLEFQRKGLKYYCVTDDKIARKIGEKWGVRVTGTIGIIKYLVTESVLDKTKARELISTLDQSRFRKW